MDKPGDAVAMVMHMECIGRNKRLLLSYMWVASFVRAHCQLAGCGREPSLRPSVLSPSTQHVLPTQLMPVCCDQSQRQSQRQQSSTSCARSCYGLQQGQYEGKGRRIAHHPCPTVHHSPPGRMQRLERLKNVRWQHRGLPEGVSSSCSPQEIEVWPLGWQFDICLVGWDVLFYSILSEPAPRLLETPLTASAGSLQAGSVLAIGGLGHPTLVALAVGTPVLSHPYAWLHLDAIAGLIRPLNTRCRTRPIPHTRANSLCLAVPQRRVSSPCSPLPHVIPPPPPPCSTPSSTVHTTSC